MGLLDGIMQKLRGRDQATAVACVADGVRAAQAGNLEESLRCYRKAVRADGEYALAHLNVGLALQDIYNRDRPSLPDDERGGRLEEIVGVLDRAASLDLQLATTFSARGYVLRALGRDVEAIADLTRYLELAPVEDVRRKSVEADLPPLRTRVALAEKRTAALAVVRDDEATAEQQAEAVHALAEVGAAEPSDAELWWGLGVLRRKLGDEVAALQSFTACLDLEPQHVGAHRELASMAFKAGQLDRALHHAQSAYQLDPTDAAVVCNLGVVFLERGELTKAAEYIELARKLDPDDPIITDCLQALDKARGAAH